MLGTFLSIILIFYYQFRSVLSGDQSVFSYLIQNLLFLIKMNLFEYFINKLSYGNFVTIDLLGGTYECSISGLIEMSDEVANYYMGLIWYEYCSIVYMRIPRLQILCSNSYFHLCWQFHDNKYFFKKDRYKQIYYNLLLRYCRQYKITILQYVIMGNHFHLLGHCNAVKDLSAFMQVVNSSFARLYNKENKRRGQVFLDRFKSPQIRTYNDLNEVMAYIDNNPVLAKIVKHNKDYKYSSHGYYAYGKNDPLITPSPSYLALSSNPKKRMKIYRKMIKYFLGLKSKILRSRFFEKLCEYKNIEFKFDADMILSSRFKNRSIADAFFEFEVKVE